MLHLLARNMSDAARAPFERRPLRKATLGHYIPHATRSCYHPPMEPSRGCLLFGAVVFALNIACAGTEDPHIDIPEKLLSAEGKVVVSSTPCSVTCGLGFKIDEVCLVKPDGSKTQCEKRQEECLTSWDCGLKTFTISNGTLFHIDCFSPDTVGLGLQSFLYTWRYARGIISTDDMLFRPYRTPQYIIVFNTTKEENAGTYRCDVLQLKTSMLVKRIYFGLRIISDIMVRLNFEKFLVNKKELDRMAAEAEAEDKSLFSFIRKRLDVQLSWEQRALFVGLVGVCSGLVAAGIIWGVTQFFYMRQLKKSQVLVEE